MGAGCKGSDLTRKRTWTVAAELTHEREGGLSEDRYPATLVEHFHRNDQNLR